MKIYLAGPCDTENRYNMVQITKVFREYGGYEVYCVWAGNWEKASWICDNRIEPLAQKHPILNFIASII